MRQKRTSYERSGKGSASYPRQDARSDIAMDCQLAAVAQRGCRRAPPQRLGDADAIFASGKQVLGQADPERVGRERLLGVCDLGDGQSDQPFVIEGMAWMVR